MLLFLGQLVALHAILISAWAGGQGGFWGGGVLGLFRVQGSGFRVQGSGFRVQGLGFRV